jgi:hypothetical protein
MGHKHTQLQAVLEKAWPTQCIAFTCLGPSYISRGRASLRSSRSLCLSLSQGGAAHLPPLDCINSLIHNLQEGLHTEGRLSCNMCTLSTMQQEGPNLTSEALKVGTDVKDAGCPPLSAFSLHCSIILIILKQTTLHSKVNTPTYIASGLQCTSC